MRTCRAFGAAGQPWVAWALSLSVLCACSSSKDVVLLSMRAPSSQPVRAYALTVQDRASRQVVYRSGVQQVDPVGGTARDLSGTPLRMGLVMDAQGSYLFYLRGFPDLPASGAAAQTTLFWAAVLPVAGSMEVPAALLPVPPNLDQDGDGFPDGPLFMTAVPEAAAAYRDHPEVLDCVDRDPGPGQPPLPAGLHAADINPLAQVRCGLPLDVSCSGQTQTCVDADGDGDPEGSDCDDHDPRRYHGNPRPRNCCVCTDRESCSVTHDQLPADLCNPPRCNSDFDYDCTGQSVDCFRDDDCDGYSPDDPVAGQRDCDDHDPLVHPGAAKNCNDPSKDWACDGNPKGGCVDCDLDGDGYQRQDPPNMPGAHCPAADNPHPGQIDCDDTDRGVFPGSTRYEGATLIVRDLNGQEGGSVAGALRGLCKNHGASGQPQDADCNGQSQQGCPPANCDADGDGFPVNKAGCTAGPAGFDCDDTDPHTFPGAPDHCGDGKAQNCVSDLPCSNDKDGDHYNADVDCDDNDPTVHPFAAEICNGKDDDCDGLIDELNPDATGTPMVESHLVNGQTVSSTRSCSDSDVGDCGLLNAATGGKSGRCVCTGVMPTTKPNLQSRTVCPAGTSAGAATAPRCFFATQPALQTCVADSPHDEDCDGRMDAPDGKNLKEYGNVCGVSTGQCKAGKVVGCDRGKLNPFSRAAGRSVVPAFPDSQRYLVCDANTIPPRDELCNGLDDDCDGKLPGQGLAAPLPSGDEADHDKDLYMACAGCDGLTLSASVKGCNDCNDLDATVHPGAKELCDGKDNDCAGAAFVDGADDCKVGAATTCCQGPPMCIDVTTNFANCGRCGMGCSMFNADHCGGGSCLCGMNAACGGMTPACSSGTCVQCVADGQCMKPTPRCGPANACVACVGDGDCTTAPQLRCNASNACVQCVADGDCKTAPLLHCKNMTVCVECLADGDCKTAPRNKCSNNACVQCVADAGCPATQPHCVTGLCVCQNNAECPASQPHCVMGGCVCQSNTECPANQPKCISGACTCGDSSDCPANQPKCVAGTCTCTANADCPAAAPNCMGGVCVM